MKHLFFTATALLALAACSGAEEAEPAPENSLESFATQAAPTPTATAAPVLALEGLGDLQIGFSVPASSNWAPLGVQAGDGCTLYSSPDYPGVSAIVTGGLVRRITAGPDSDVKLVEGIGPGSTEEEVRSAFGGFRETPHKYEAAPAKYLTAPNADSGESALRIEIGADGKVSEVHVGTMPELGFVEGCA